MHNRTFKDPNADLETLLTTKPVIDTKYPSMRVFQLPFDIRDAVELKQITRTRYPAMTIAHLIPIAPVLFSFQVAKN